MLEKEIRVPVRTAQHEEEIEKKGREENLGTTHT